MERIQVKINKHYVQRYKEGYPLIEKNAIHNLKDLQVEGQILELIDTDNHYIATGYFGRQNKGYGWVLSDKPTEAIDATYFLRKINRAINYRQKMFASEETTAFRIFNGEGDGIGGLTIDYFDGFYLINWYSAGIYKYKDQIIDALGSNIVYKGIYEKKRFDQQGQVIEGDSFVCGERADEPLVVKENNVKFAIYLNEGPMVGVFLDQRDVRKKLRDTYAKNKTVLNTFSYTGAFSIFAARGGATKTTSVDVANRSLSKTIEQFAINEIDYEAHDIVVMDVFNYFDYAEKNGYKFDVVVLDPPSFARTKKHQFSASKDYTQLLKETIAITEEQGVIVASTNCSTFDMKTFKSFIHDAFVESHKGYKIIDEFGLPEDFRTHEGFKEGNYLKVVFIRLA